MGGQRDRAAAILDRAHRQTYYEQDGKIYVRTYQDVEGHLKYAAAMRRADREHTKFGRRGEFRPKMSVPFNVVLGVAEKLGIPAGKIFDKEAARRIDRELRGPDYKNFRTTEAKI